jgi:predicted alpha-1,6-mannanase (GH76 family)
MRASRSRDFLADLSETYRAHHGRDGFLNDYYDDEGWWALTWISAYDLTGNADYLGQARNIFADMTGGWDGACGGGIWWSKARHYKNAIANEIFLQVAAGLHERTLGDTAYGTWAKREWAWFQGTGMLTGSHLVIDGLAGCKPDMSSPTWTYNQGMLIGGLVSLARMTGRRAAPPTGHTSGTTRWPCGRATGAAASSGSDGPARSMRPTRPGRRPRWTSSTPRCRRADPWPGPSAPRNGSPWPIGR